MPKTKKQPYENTDSIGMNVMRIKWKDNKIT